MTADLRAPDRPEQEPELGTVIGGCRLERVLGRGGMGVVYLAEQEALRRKVAVKVIAGRLAQDVAFHRRFERESQLAASIDHPNIVPVYSAGEEDGRLYVVMRYVDGADLRRVLADHTKLTPERALRITTDVAAALDAAHARYLVHRDVKPGNVLLGAMHEQAYLSDFGLMKDLAADTEVTRTGQVVGTLDYIAPEQLRGAPLGPHTDVYSLGCMLFQMLSGTVPYPGSDLQKMWAHANAPLPSLPGPPGLGAAFDPVIQRAMAKDPDDRFPSAGDLARAASAALNETREQATTVTAAGAPPVKPPTPADTPTSTPTAPPMRAPRGRRHRLPVAGAVVAVAIAGGILLGALDRASDEPADAPAIAGTNRPDVLAGTSGADRVNALRGDDHVDGGGGPDVLSGGGGNDVLIGGEDDAVDRISCGRGKDVVIKLDTSDLLQPSCEKAGWTIRAPAPALYENTISVTPAVRRDVVSFSARCRAACTGVLELRDPNTRDLLASGGFKLAAGRPGPIVAALSPRGETLHRGRRQVRVVLRASRDCRDCARPPLLVNSGFTGFF